MPRTAVASRTPVATRIANLVLNGNFEIQPPSFTAVTSTNQRWIDGTAAGSTIGSAYGWAVTSAAGGFGASFDTSTSNSGTASLKVSTTATGSFIECHTCIQQNATKMANVIARCLPSTLYKCTFAMKTNYVSGDSSDGALVAIVPNTSAFAAITTVTSTKVKTTTGWTNYSLTFTTASNAAYLDTQLRVYGHTGTATLIMDAWFDDIKVYPLRRTAVAARTVVA